MAMTKTSQISLTSTVTKGIVENGSGEQQQRKYLMRLPNPYFTSRANRTARRLDAAVELKLTTSSL